MHTYLSSVFGDVLPGLVLVFVSTMAAVPPYLALRHTARGRARSSIGYLMGLAAGLATTIFVIVLVSATAKNDEVAMAGLIGAFFGPFIGMLRAKRRRKQRPRRRVVVEGFSS